MSKYFIGPDVSGQAFIRGFTGDFELQEIKPETFHEYLGRTKPKLRNKLMAPKNVKITKKFYVGAPHLIEDNRDYCHLDLRSAVNEAMKKCEESGEPQIVVQIIRVVRPKSVPIVVERV